MSRFDVAVIGGGIAGTSAAFFLAERASVVVLEGESTLGFHSTGRSAAVFTECYGESVVRRLALASRRFLAGPPDGFTDVSLLAPRGIAFVATSAQEGLLAPSLAEQQQLVPSVRGLSAREAANLCPVLDREIVGGVLESDAKDLDVHALHTGYQRGIRHRGGEIRTKFAVDRIERHDDAWTVACGNDRVEAGVVIDAAGAWCDVVAAAAGVDPIGLVPKRRTVFTFEPPSGVDHRSWPMIVDIDEQFYFKPEGPSLLASPGDETPVEPHDVPHREEDVALGIERIQSVTTMSIRSIQNAWAGLRSFVADNRPVNGWDPAVPGFYWLAGQGGFGIKTSPAMGRYAASMILDGGPPADLASSGLDAESLGVERLNL
jgi:D-arginine dehydrogenase